MISALQSRAYRSAFSSLIALSLLVGGAGCEPSSEEPMMTVGAIPKQRTQTNEGHPKDDSSDRDEAASPAQNAEQSALAPAELPEGTPEQQEKMNLARAAFLSDRYEIAEGLFAELARAQPVTGTTVSAALALAQIFIETDRPEEALDLLNDVRKSVEDLPEVLLVIARVYRQLERPAEALRTFDRALQVQPNYIFIYTEMAQIFFEEDDKERGQQLLLRYEQKIEQLATALEDQEKTSEEERIYLVDIFALIHDERGHQALIKALEDQSPHIRARAAQALGELAVYEAKDALEQIAVEDSSELVRPAARRALLELSAAK